MAETKGYCKKHGEFILRDGCPQCLAERRQAGITPAQDELEDGLNQEGLTLAGAEEPATEKAPTSIIRVKPEQDMEVQSFYSQSLQFQEFAEHRVITIPEDLKPATDDLSIIAKVKRALEEKRKEYVKPLQDYIKEINDAFKKLMQPIEAADSITREKILVFNKDQNRIRQEQEEINRMRMEAAQKEKALKGEITEPVELVEVAPEAPKRVSTDMGMVGQRMIRKWELVDMALVPEEYKILDGTKITKVVKAGIPSIPGIRIYEEPILTVSAR